ncbi:hypothetical protein [Micromonospora sp. NPDC049662]|uniref:hypothetical protein n=1 Tax=Micromonospora sp. NPDC049662 TaxID=3155397 RepID=UPI0034496169
MTSNDDLRRMLAAPPPIRPVSADAADFAAFRVGADVAALIAWGDQLDDEGRVHGRLHILHLRFDQPEPASAQLEVRVACPTDPTCIEAWDQVEHRVDLLGVLDGGLAAGDPFCEIHDDGH